MMILQNRMILIECIMCITFTARELKPVLNLFNFFINTKSY